MPDFSKFVSIFDEIKINTFNPCAFETLVNL